MIKKRDEGKRQNTQMKVETDETGKKRWMKEKIIFFLGFLILNS